MDPEALLLAAAVGAVGLAVGAALWALASHGPAERRRQVLKARLDDAERPGAHGGL